MPTPVLAAYNNRLYMAWKGQGNPGIWFSSFDGTNWAPQQEITGLATSVGPALAVYSDRLYMAWKGIVGDQGIYFSSLSNWAPQQKIADVATDVEPSEGIGGV